MPTGLAAKETDLASITVEKILQKRSEDTICKQVAETAAQSESQYDHDCYQLLIQNSALDRVVQRVVAKRLRARALYLAQYLQLAGHPGGSKM